MSRFYEMTVRFTGHDPVKRDDIEQACAEVWPFEDFFESADGDIEATAKDYLCGGESDREFTDRIAKAIWTANGKFCKVEVVSVYLEDLPSELHLRDEADYKNTMGEAACEPSQPTSSAT